MFPGRNNGEEKLNIIYSNDSWKEYEPWAKSGFLLYVEFNVKAKFLTFANKQNMPKNKKNLKENLSLFQVFALLTWRGWFFFENCWIYFESRLNFQHFEVNPVFIGIIILEILLLLETFFRKTLVPSLSVYNFKVS